MPPLRERREDIPLLAAQFIKEMCTRENKMLIVSDEVMEIFQNAYWPGNIRQLKNIVERAVVLAKGDKITVKELPREFLGTKRHAAGAQLQVNAQRTGTSDDKDCPSGM